MLDPIEIGSTKMFEGYNKRYKHYSQTLGCAMNFHIFFPPSRSPSQKFPVLYWLSGITCTDEDFITKSGAQRAASSKGVVLIAPDTSPRGLNVEGGSDNMDFGVELDMSPASIFGHGMGGHGALTIYLKNLDKYKSVSAFAPIANPTNCPCGMTAFINYLGENKDDWMEYDATCLVSRCNNNNVSGSILIDQVEADELLSKNELLPEEFEKACTDAGVAVVLRRQSGYDHLLFYS